ncbi:MAG TPA: hypothetical protein VK787_00780 [Puia sp.]|jgi:hypothetical protein|nr:hypothetical protein [Puia sp.]
MGVLDDINKSGESFRGFLFSVISFGCFFYIDLYFTRQAWFEKTIFYVPIIFSLVMAISWYGACMCIVGVSSKSDLPQENINRGIAIFGISLLIPISIITLFFHLSFHVLFYICLGTSIASFLIAAKLTKSENAEK